MADPPIDRKDGKERLGRCPLLEQPDSACYCMNMNSLIIPAAIKYCLGNFTECPVRRFLLHGLAP